MAHSRSPGMGYRMGVAFPDKISIAFCQPRHRPGHIYIVFVIALVALISFHKLINIATHKRHPDASEPRSPRV